MKLTNYLTLFCLMLSLTACGQTKGHYVRVNTVTEVFFSPDTVLNVVTTDSTFRDTIRVPYGGQVDSIIAGENIGIDNTDPTRPIISAIASGGAGIALYIDNTAPGSRLPHSDAQEGDIFIYTGSDTGIGEYASVHENTIFGWLNNTGLSWEKNLGQSLVVQGSNLTLGPGGNTVTLPTYDDTELRDSIAALRTDFDNLPTGAGVGKAIYYDDVAPGSRAPHDAAVAGDIFIYSGPDDGNYVNGGVYQYFDPPGIWGFNEALTWARGVDTLIAGSNVTINNLDPAAPIISFDAGGGGGTPPTPIIKDVATGSTTETAVANSIYVLTNFSTSSRQMTINPGSMVAGDHIFLRAVPANGSTSFLFPDTYDNGNGFAQSTLFASAVANFLAVWDGDSWLILTL